MGGERKDGVERRRKDREREREAGRGEGGNAEKGLLVRIDQTKVRVHKYVLHFISVNIIGLSHFSFIIL